jgi:hypothetical protein
MENDNTKEIIAEFTSKLDALPVELRPLNLLDSPLEVIGVDSKDKSAPGSLVVLYRL